MENEQAWGASERQPMKARHFFFLGVGIALLITGAFGAVLFTRPYTYNGSRIDPPLAIEDFELTDQFGQPFRLSEMLSSEEDVRAVLVFFGYTYCPDVCPITLIEFKQIKERLGKEADSLRFVFITVDPERDDVEKLRRHMDIYDPTFIGLTGDRASLEKVWDSFFIYTARQEVDSPSGYLVDHTSRVYVLDSSGNVSLTFVFGSGSEAMSDDLRHFIRQKPGR
jgi:protein SCO1